MRTTALHPDRWHELAPIFREEFGTLELPDPGRTTVRALFDGDGEIVGFYLLEQVIHAGPFWVAPKYRENGVARKLAEEALELTEGEEGYIAATRPEIEHLAEDLGLVKIAGSLWCKEATHVR